jgi:hypothetical protein
VYLLRLRSEWTVLYILASVEHAESREPWQQNISYNSYNIRQYEICQAAFVLAHLLQIFAVERIAVVLKTGLERVRDENKGAASYNYQRVTLFLRLSVSCRVLPCSFKKFFFSD